MFSAQRSPTNKKQTLRMMHVAKLLMIKGMPSVSKVTEGVLAAGRLTVASATDDEGVVLLPRACQGEG